MDDPKRLVKWWAEVGFENFTICAVGDFEVEVTGDELATIQKLAFLRACCGVGVSGESEGQSLSLLRSKIGSECAGWMAELSYEAACERCCFGRAGAPMYVEVIFVGASLEAGGFSYSFLLFVLFSVCTRSVKGGTVVELQCVVWLS